MISLVGTICATFLFHSRYDQVNDMDTSELQKQYHAGKRDFRGVDLTRAYLPAANLCNADFSEADLSDALLYDANLLEVNLSRANLSRTNLSGSKLNKANLCGADLTGADLAYADFEGCLYDQDTRFPEGFDPVHAKMSLSIPKPPELPTPDLTSISPEAEVSTPVVIETTQQLQNQNFSEILIPSVATRLPRLRMPDELPYAKCQQKLQYLLQAQCPLIFLRSPEESRAFNCAIAAHQKVVSNSNVKHGELARWSSINGFFRHSLVEGQAKWENLGTAPESNTDPIIHALNLLQEHLQQQATKNTDSQYTYLLPDWSALIQPDCHLTARLLKELIIAIDQKRPQPKMTLIVIGSDWSIPPILRPHVHILDLPLPIGQELYNDVFRNASKYGLEDEEAQRLAEQAQGMSLQSATQAAKLITARQLWSQPQAAAQLLLEVKKQEIRKTGVLEYYTPQGQGLDKVGGLKGIKAWVRSRQPWFEQDSSPELRPRAILLEGFPGCGKTFIARAIAQDWRVPQINFEISRLQSKWVGESESNTFQALRAIEASAPNILFMDEIEKAFSGVGGDTSGVTTRQFGTFLSWLNDHNYPIFFIATSNDRTALPQEMFRAGRFDEIFIVMPPNTQERYEIIQKRAQAYRLPAIQSSILEFLVANTAGFSGAELDKLVKEAIYFAGFEQLPGEKHWQNALEQVQPQYRTPKMQDLLYKYLKLLEEEGGKPASDQESNFWRSLMLS